MNSRSARAQIEGECFDKEVIFKSPEPTTRVLSRGGVIEYRAYKYPNKTSTEHGTQATTNCTSWRSDGSPSCLGGHHTGGSRVITPTVHRCRYDGSLWVAQHRPTTHDSDRQCAQTCILSDPFTRLRENIIASSSDEELPGSPTCGARSWRQLTTTASADNEHVPQAAKQRGRTQRKQNLVDNAVWSRVLTLFEVQNSARWKCLGCRVPSYPQGQAQFPKKEFSLKSKFFPPHFQLKFLAQLDRKSWITLETRRNSRRKS